MWRPPYSLRLGCASFRTATRWNTQNVEVVRRAAVEKVVLPEVVWARVVAVLRPLDRAGVVVKDSLPAGIHEGKGKAAEPANHSTKRSLRMLLPTLTLISLSGLPFSPRMTYLISFRSCQ